MPYISRDQRIELDMGRRPVDAGELNYWITDAILYYLSKIVGRDTMKLRPSYTDYNEVIGVLECVKLELYRRKVAPHEDDAKERNGDVYE